MLCREVKRVAYFFLDGSLGSRSLKAVTTHLGICHDCEARIRIQKQLRQFIRRRLAPLNAPERLKVRLTRTLRAFGAD